MNATGVTVFGSRGMLGQTVVNCFRRCGWRVVETQFDDRQADWFFDAAQATEESCERLIETSGCSYGVNCIGVLKAAVDEQDSRSVTTAIRVNALFPHVLAQSACKTGLRLIHMSTDGVFAGGQTDPYFENHHPNCTDHYGRTKALGEPLASAVLNIRCSIVGRDAMKGKGLLEWLVRQPEDAEVKGFRDHFWNGVTTLQFGTLCERIFSTGAFDRVRAVSGVLHFCPNPATNKYQLLCDWAHAIGKKIAIQAADSGTPDGSRLLGTRFDCLEQFYEPPGEWPEIFNKLLDT